MLCQVAPVCESILRSGKWLENAACKVACFGQLSEVCFKASRGGYTSLSRVLQCSRTARRMGANKLASFLRSVRRCKPHPSEQTKVATCGRKYCDKTLTAHLAHAPQFQMPCVGFIATIAGNVVLRFGSLLTSLADHNT